MFFTVVTPTTNITFYYRNQRLGRVSECYKDNDLDEAAIIFQVFRSPRYKMSKELNSDTKGIICLYETSVGNGPSAQTR